MATNEDNWIRDTLIKVTAQLDALDKNVTTEIGRVYEILKEHISQNDKRLEINERKLAELDKKIAGIDGSVAVFKDTLIEHKVRFKEDESRTKKLEEWKWKEAGAIGLFLALLSVILKLI